MKKIYIIVCMVLTSAFSALACDCGYTNLAVVAYCIDCGVICVPSETNSCSDMSWSNNVELLDNSMADTLHGHSQLRASDGAPTNVWTDADGDLGVGTKTPAGSFNVAKAAASMNSYLDAYSDTTTHGPALTFRKSNSDTLGTKTETIDNHVLGSIFFNGVDTGSGFDQGAQIIATQNGAAGVRIPADLVLATWSSTAKNSNQLALDHTGNVGIGITPVQKLHVHGVIAISNTNDIPTASAGGCGFYVTNSTAEMYVIDASGNRTLLSAHDGDMAIDYSYNDFTGREYYHNKVTGETRHTWRKPSDTWAAYQEREFQKGEAVRATWAAKDTAFKEWEAAEPADPLDLDAYAAWNEAMPDDPGEQPAAYIKKPAPTWVGVGLTANTAIK